MKRPLLTAVAVLCVSFLLPVTSFPQGSNARLSGTISDATGALIPGVEVTATNTATGVVSTALSNTTGTYNFPSLLPGVYTVTAVLPGFQTQTFTDVRLGNAAQVRLNFDLQVAGAATEVEVTASAGELLLESSSSVGEVLDSNEVVNLPNIGAMGNDVLDLVRVMGGVQMTDNPIFGGNDTALAGVSASNVNIQRDGIEASMNARWPAGIEGATIMNPDLVGELRVILAPVDAEVGRGNSQIAVQTKSGTNEFHGTVGWNVQNSALEPNTWDNNNDPGGATTPPWNNLQEWWGSIGGPIVENKTHFFFLFDGLEPQSRSNINAQVLTPCAARGVFRYYDNWNNGGFNQPTTGGSTPDIAVVDAAGNPVAPQFEPDGVTPHNGILRHVSPFGIITNQNLDANCSNFNPATDLIAAPTLTGSWDPFRTGPDPTGYIQQVLDVMPEPNNWDDNNWGAMDGLNTAVYQWVRPNNGAINRFGFGSAEERRQLNLRIDHVLNDSHKVNGGWTYEHNSSDYSSGNWPFRFPGRGFRKPQVLTTNFSSTLSPSLLNEARFGMRRTGTNQNHGLSNPETSEEMIAFYPNVSGIPVWVEPGFASDNPICFCGGQPGGGSQAGNLFNAFSTENSRMYTFADTVAWTRGVHAFKFGAEYRRQTTGFAIDVTGNDWRTYASAAGGEIEDRSPITGIDATNFPGLAGTRTAGNQEALRAYLTLLSGSIGEMTELFWLGSATDLSTWDDYRDNPQRDRVLNQHELSFFFKDDYKVTQNLTLNLGMRWDYYGVPWVSDGLTLALDGGGYALFGGSGRGFNDWFASNPTYDPALETDLIFVGPDSLNPDLRPWPQDRNNFGPAIGFAYDIPWFGTGQTVVRGGYQASFLTRALGGLDGDLANAPGSSYNSTFQGGPGALNYLDLTDLPDIVPTPVNVLPMESIPATDRSVSLDAFDPNLVTPYVQNLTLAVTHNVTRNFTVDVKYVGTLSRKMYGSINLNEENFLTASFQGERLIDAFNSARAGGESPLLDAMFNGINVVGDVDDYGAVGTVFDGELQTGAMHLRAAAATRTNLANGNYEGLASTLNTLNYIKDEDNPGNPLFDPNPGLPSVPANVQGTILRNSGLFPENFIKANPQFNNATWNSNTGHQNYHSLQLQGTLRPTYGVNLQATYIWSKTLGIPGDANYTTPFDRHLDYTLQQSHRSHDFRTYGTFNLPVGPNQLFFGNSSGWVARVIEGWQTSWIFSATTGAPGYIQAQDMLYDAGVPDLVGPFDPSLGEVRWDDGAPAGNYFSEAYSKVADPQCANVTALQGLQGRCSIDAVADSSGTIVLQNPLPGTRGNLGQNVIELPGTWTLDSSVAKSVQVMEDIALKIRFDALNLLNHPQPGNPVLNINSNDAFGEIDSKSGNRVFKLEMKLEF